MTVWAVVPAFNEEERVAATVGALYERVGCSRVIVVDDGSCDGTARSAARSGAHVIRMPKNGGKGRALARGAQEVETQGDDVHVVLLADADLGESAGRLFPLVEAVRRGETDVAIASFASRGGFGVAKRIASRGILLLTGKRFQSPLSGQRALSRRALSLFASLPSGWGVEVAMTVRALQNGLHVMEVPLSLSHRETRRDLAGFVHRGRQCCQIVSTLGWLAWMKRRPDRVLHRTGEGRHCD